MTRRKIEIGAFNIRIHPHSDNAEDSIELYTRLINMVVSQHLPVKLRGDTYGMFARVSKLKRYVSGYSKSNALLGAYYKFTNIDTSKGWLDLRKQEIADDDEVSQIQIPSYLKPNTDDFYFIFFPDTHTFFYQIISHNKNFSCNYMKKLIEESFLTEEILSEFNEICITEIPDKENVEWIVNNSSLTDLVIDIQGKPNPDHGLERKIRRRMRSGNIARLKVELNSEKNKSLSLDEEHKDMARFASGHGEVSGKYIDEHGLKVPCSSKEKPWKEFDRYDTDLYDESSAFAKLAHSFKTIARNFISTRV